jgi:hypothetical protein
MLGLAIGGLVVGLLGLVLTMRGISEFRDLRLRREFDRLWEHPNFHGTRFPFLDLRDLDPEEAREAEAIWRSPGLSRPFRRDKYQTLWGDPIAPDDVRRYELVRAGERRTVFGFGPVPTLDPNARPVRWALRILPANEADRYRREWGAHLDERVRGGEIKAARLDRMRFIFLAIGFAIVIRIRSWAKRPKAS